MSKVFGAERQITLGKLLISLSAIFLLLAFSLIIVLSGVVRERAVNDLATANAQKTSRLVFQSLYSAMRKGWSKHEIKDTIDQLNTSVPGLSIRIYRSDIVARQYGEMPGERDAIAADRALASVMRNGSDMTLYQGEKSIRYLYSVRADKECVACHQDSSEGSVHGVIDVTYPIDSIKVSLNHVINPIVSYFMLVIGLVFAVLYFLLHRLVAVPLVKLVDVMQRISHEADFSHRVEGRHRIFELQRLSEYFNHLLTTVQNYNTRLEELSVRDPLTGLYNRRKFEEVLDQEIVRCERYFHTFSIIMVDLDNFKFINDTYGHPVGDLVLKELSVFLGADLRRGDLLARLGGDEFALILPDTPASTGQQVAHKLHKLLGEKEFDVPVGKIGVTASFSMVSYPDDGKTKEDIYSAMDVVLYKAKSLGKNQVMMAESAHDRTMMSIFRHGDFLRQALREDRIEAFLQPIVDVRANKVVAYEALARIRDGDNVIAASEFIEVADELGMSRDVDRTVFRKALEHLAKIGKDDSGVKMFFNLSARSFGDIEWMRTIPGMAREMGVACENIVLEITEREALPHLNQVKDVIDELRLSHIAFALDDFGSGFSSFLYLKYLEVDYVKIEGSFVRQIAVDDRDRIMVEHIHKMAKEFGLKTVAELVEDELTAKMLAQMGVDFSQGHYYGYPALPD